MTQMLEIQTPADVEAELPVVVSWAIGLKITTAEDFTEAGQRLQQIKGMARRITDFFEPMKQRQDEAKRAILDAEKKLAGPLEQAETMAKHAMLTFQRAEAEKARVEQARLQAIADEEARKIRERAEQEAAKQRQIESDARAKAEAERRAAQEATNAEERRRATVAAEAAERKAAAAAVKVEASDDKAAAAIAPVVQVATVAPVVKGISTVKKWKAEIVDLPALLDFICTRRRDDLIIVNKKMLQAFAQSMTRNAQMPGVRFYEDSNISIRSY